MRWPSQLEGMFEFQGALSTVGDHLVNPDCVANPETAAELYYSKQKVFATLPVLFCIVAFLGWYLYGKRTQQPFFRKREGRNDTTTKDKWVMTLTTVLYLIYPTLCKNAFGLFDCKKIGANWYFKVDLEEQCYVGAHAWHMWTLGLGQISAYVIGFPLVVFLFLRRNKTRLRRHVVVARYGLFFGMYKKEMYFWEVFVAARKVSIVMLSVFGPEVGPEKQAHVALLILLVCLVVEIWAMPYAVKEQRDEILGKLELASLLVCWWTMWSGLMIYKIDSDAGEGMLLTVTVLVANFGLVLIFVAQFIKAKRFETKRKAEEAKRLGIQRNSFLKKSMSRISNSFSGSLRNFKLKTGSFNIPYVNPMAIKPPKDVPNAVVNPVFNTDRSSKDSTAAPTFGGRPVRDAVSTHRTRGPEHKSSAENYKKASAVEMVVVKTTSRAENDTRNPVRKLSFRQLTKDDGSVYYEDLESGQTCWRLPTDSGEVVIVESARAASGVETGSAEKDKGGRTYAL